MFHPESNPLAPKPSGPLKSEKDLVEIWLGKDAAAEMDERGPEAGDEDLDTSPAPTLTEKEKQALWEMKRADEVTLKNIPTWKELPDKEIFTKDFKIDWMWEEEYREGRPVEEFEVQNKTEALPHAKVFDIGNVILEKQEQDPSHPDTLTTAEVLEAIDAAGYRPATLEELLAYGRDYWKPDANPKTLTKAERELQNAQAPSIYGLNSVFPHASGDRLAPHLGWREAGRDLGAGVLEDGWDADIRFLVLRKASPS